MPVAVCRALSVRFTLNICLYAHAANRVLNVMLFKLDSFPKASLSLSILGVVVFASQAHAIDVPPGFVHVVKAGDSVENYSLKSAHLIVRENAATGAIGAHQGSRVDIDGARVSSSGTVAVDLYDSVATINNSIISAIRDSSLSSNENFGIRLSGQTAKAIVTGSQVHGIGRGINVAGGSSLILDNTDVLGSDGADPVGPVEGGVGVVIAGSTADIRNGSHVVGDGNGIVMISQLRAGNLLHSSLTVDGSHVEGTNGSAVLVSGRTGLQSSHADINISNGSTLTGGNGVILEVNSAGSATFNVSESQLTGDVLVSDDSTADLSLVSNSSLTGSISHATLLNIDSSSRWIMEGDSTVGKLDLNGGLVDLRGTSEGFHSLTLGELAGTGTFALGTDLAAWQGDRLEVTGNATGKHKLLVQNTGIDPLAGAGPQQLIHTGSGDAQFSLIGNKVDFGTFAYELKQTTNANGGADWSLVQTSDFSASSRSVIGLFSAAPSVWYGETSTLRSRMGEVRNGQTEGGGWMRSYGNKYNMSAGGGVAYSQVQQGISFGADAPLPSSNGQWLVGLIGGYSKSDLDLKEGTKGEVDSFYVGAYTTWLAEDGFYVDALIKANRFQNSSDVVMRDGEKSKGSYRNYGIGASVEAGKHIKLDDVWFVEPFVQASGLLVSGENYDLDNGMKASSNRADSFLGKAGTQAGRTFALKDGGFVQPYVKVAVSHEFVSSNKVRINSNRFTNDLSGSRAELGAGVAAQLTDVLQVHADFDYMKGNSIEQPWGVSVGVRYNW